MTAETITFYDMLNITPDADTAAVKKAWRRIAKDDHPDLNGGSPSPRYLAAQRAYQTLIDPSSRRSYDATLGQSSTTSSSQQRGGHGQTQAPPAGGRAHQNTRTRNSSSGGGRSSSTGDGVRIPRPTIAFRTSPTVTNPDYLPRIRTATPEEGRTPRTRRQTIALISLTVAWAAVAVTLLGVSMLSGFWTFPSGWAILSAIAILALTVFQLVNTVTFSSGTGTFTVALAGGVAAAAVWPLPGTTTVSVIAGLVHTAACLTYCFASPYRFRTRGDSRPVMNAKTAQFPIFGRPASGLSGQFGETGEIGALGERATAEMLEQQLLPHLPGARIFYGLKMFPGTDSEADVDFAVLYGRKLALGDAKVWRSGTYIVSDYPNAPEVFVDFPDGSEAVREVHMNAAAEAHTLYLDGYAKVQPFVVVHPPQGEGVEHTFHNSSNNRMLIGSPEDIFNDMVDWLLDQPEHDIVIDRRLMAGVAATLKR